jgi:hypothetical protein
MKTGLIYTKSGNPVISWTFICLVLLASGSCKENCLGPNEGCHEVCNADNNRKCHYGKCECLGTEPEYFIMEGPTDHDIRCWSLEGLAWDRSAWQVINDGCDGMFKDAILTYKGTPNNSLALQFFLRNEKNQLYQAPMESFGGEDIYVEHPDGRITMEFFLSLTNFGYFRRYNGERIVCFFKAEIDTDKIMRVDVNIRREEIPRTLLHQCRFV